MRRSVFVLVTVLALVLVACGGDDGETAGDTGPTATTGATGGIGTTGSGDCPDLTSGQTFTITTANFAFVPSCFTALASQGITIVNEDSAAHTFTISGTPIDVEIGGGETFNGEPVSGVLEPGEYGFFCRFHPSMTGTVTVQ